MSKEVLVVIGTGGMGAAIARRVGPGKRVLLADLRQDTLDILADTMRGEGHDVHTQTVDVSSPESVGELAVRASGLGSVRFLAHTAGLSPAQAPVRAILDVDLIGVALVVDVFGEVIADHGAGVVVSSMAAQSPYPIDADLALALATAPGARLREHPLLQPETFGRGQMAGGMAYVLSKRANLIRVRAAAAEWGLKGARINTISPGVISTPMGQTELAGASGDAMRAMVENAGVRRLGTPEDIAAAADFLLGPQASFITGTDLLVDGGVTAAQAG